MPQAQLHRFAMPRRASVVSFVLMALFLLVASLSQPAESQTYKVIHNFTGQGKDGATPYGGPVLDGSGNLYGATYLGGTFGSGMVYRLAPAGSSWKGTSLYSLTGPNGAGPAFGTLAIHNGALFGTTEGGLPFGTAFEVSEPCKTTCRYTVVHRFGTGTDGAQPIGGVVFDTAGNLYGTTSLGGTYGNGTVFEVTSSGVESVIYSFNTSGDPINPPAGVTVDPAGNLYGTSSLGGAFGNGAIYKLSRSGSGWTETVLYDFQGLNDGANPVGGVILDKAGNLYGGTFDGGVNGGGTVYELSPSAQGWTMTILYSFTGGYGGPYNKLTFDAKGDLYGATNGEGANGFGLVFKLTPSKTGWTFTDLYDFVGGTQGGQPYGSVAVDAHGDVFGTAVIGGSANQGVIFEITP